MVNNSNEKPRPTAKELYDRAGKLFEEDQLEEAISLYSQAIETDQDYTNAYFNRALAYTRLARYDEAWKDLDVVSQKEPPRGDVFYVKGLVSEYRNDLEVAEYWYDKSVKVDPTDERAKNRLNTLRGVHGPLSRAVELITSIQVIKGRLDEPDLTLNDIDEVASFVRSMLPREAGVSRLVISEIWPYLAIRYANGGNTRTARSLMNEALRVSEELQVKEFEQNFLLRELTCRLIPILGSQSGRDCDPKQAQLNWRDRLSLRLRALELSIPCDEWYDSTNLKEGQAVVMKAIAETKLLLPSDDYVSTLRLRLEDLELSTRTWDGGLSESLRLARQSLWRRIEEQIGDIPPYISASALLGFLLVSPPRDSEAQRALKSHIGLLKPGMLPCLLGYWSLIDPSYRHDFGDALREFACEHTSDARWALLLSLGRIRPFEALKNTSGKTFAGDLVRTIVRREPIRDTIASYLETNEFSSDVQPLIREILDYPDESALITLALMEFSRGTDALVLRAYLEGNDPSALIKSGMGYHGIWEAAYRNLQQIESQHPAGDTTAIRDALFKILSI